MYAVLDQLERVVEGGAGADADRVRDGPVQLVRVKCFMGSVADGDDEVEWIEHDVEVPRAGSPQPQAVPTRCRDGARMHARGGCVPADAAGTGLVRRQAAAASWERAELCVHTNTTRGAVRDAADGRSDAEGSSRTYVLRRSPSERVRSTRPADSKTFR